MPSLNTGNAILSNAITVDGSYNVGIGGAANASYKLAVTGTGNFTGALRTSSTFTSGDTIQLGLASTDGGFWTWGASNSFLVAATGKALNLNPNGASGTTGLSIATTGAATFSSSVTAGGKVTINKDLEGLTVNGGTSTNAAYMSFQANTQAGWMIIGSQGSTANYIQTGAAANESVITTVGAYALSIGTNQTERMRITSGGNVFINTTTNLGGGATAQLNVRNLGSGNTPAIAMGVENASATVDGVGLFGCLRTSSSAYRLISAYSGNGTTDLFSVSQFYIRGDGYGYLNAAAWAYGSDKRLKENISYLTESGLDKIMQLKPARFDYIDGVKNNIGWVAQDVEEIIPEAVSITNEKTGMLGLKSDFIIPYLVKAIQEQQAQIEAQQQQINQLINK